MIKLLALDMDGTLLNDHKELMQAEIDAIHQAVEAGVKIVLCTGRMLTGVKPYFDQLNLGAEKEFVIVNNGCSTHQTSDWQLIDGHFITPEQVAYLDRFQQDSQMQLVLFDENHYYVVGDKANPYVEEDAKVVFVTPTPISLAEATSGNYRFFQAMFVGSQEATDHFEDQYRKELSADFDPVRSQPTILEILPTGANKASALQALAQSLDIAPADIMAVGDADNDLEMIAFAGLGIAMGNANDKVKAIAQGVTASHQENGVAQAIHTYILQTKETL